MKTPIKFDKKQLLEEVAKLNKDDYGSLSEFCQAIVVTKYVSELNNGKGVSWTWVKMRLEELGAMPKFKKKDRGQALRDFQERQKEIPPQLRVKPVRKQDKDEYQKWIATLKDRYKDPRSQKLLTRMGKGSLKATLQMKCLECCCGDIRSVKDCTVTYCPNWFSRPYQKTDIEEPDEEKVENDN